MRNLHPSGAQALLLRPVIGSIQFTVCQNAKADNLAGRIGVSTAQHKRMMTGLLCPAQPSDVRSALGHDQTDDTAPELQAQVQIAYRQNDVADAG